MASSFLQKLCLFIGIFSLLVKANTCSDKNPNSRYFPKNIGKSENAISAQYLFKCDTVEVRAGDTSRIYSNIKLYFGPQSNEKKILLIKGTLIVEGIPKYPTKFSGSLIESTQGIKLGDATWGGFRVTETGTLLLRNVVLHNASIAIDSRSKKVLLENVWTEGCLNLVRPGIEIVKLDYSGTNIAKLNFEQIDKPFDKIANPGSLDSSKKNQSEKKLSKPLLWSGAGIATAGLVGVAIWYLSSATEKPLGPSTVIPPAKIDPFPTTLDFPKDGVPRQ